MKLIINADDFGLVESVTKGIYDSITKGVVTSTTQMMNTMSKELASLLIKKDSNLSVGLHINITFGHPLTDCKSLLKNGIFIKPKDLVSDEIYDEDEIYQEIRAQYNEFLRLNNKKPTHLDSHLYIHQISEKVRRQVIRLANEEKIPVRGYENEYYNEVYFERNFKVLKNDNFSVLKEKFKKIILDNIDKEVMELMVHPGYISKELLDISSYNEQRLLEEEVLLDDDIKTFLQENNVELISYKDLERK